MKTHLTVMALVATVVSLVGLISCAPVQPSVSPGVLDMMDKPAEKALLAGLRAYDDGQYDESEKQLQAALNGGLVSARDRAEANKKLAFIFCSTQRTDACEAAFRAARAADPAFALGKSEAGHPLWGPVYKRVVP